MKQIASEYQKTAKLSRRPNVKLLISHHGSS